MKQQEDIFEMYKRQRQEEETPTEHITINEDALWQKINQKLDQQPAVKPLRPKVKSIMGIAASVAALIVIAIFYNQNAKDNTTEQVALTHSKQHTAIDTQLRTSVANESKATISNDTIKTYIAAAAPTNHKKVMRNSTTVHQDALLQLDTNAAIASVTKEIIPIAKEESDAKYAKSAIRTNEHNKMSTPNHDITNALEDNTPGSAMSSINGQPDGEHAMRIRGVSSISDTNTPLIIVDGKVYDGKLEDIDPNTIASMEIIKDADSIAQYSARAEKSGIIIKTKKANKKEAKKLHKKQKRNK